MTRIPLHALLDEAIGDLADATTDEEIDVVIQRIKDSQKIMKARQKYTIYIDDNFHHADESYRYELDQYDTWEDAVEVCKQIVRSNIDSYIAEGIPLANLYDHYVAVGDDPWVSPTPEGQNHFSAWTYAKEITNNQK